jgi:hypothetical protein
MRTTTSPPRLAVIGVAALLLAACSSSAHTAPSSTTSSAAPTSETTSVAASAPPAGSSSGTLGAGTAATDCAYISPAQLSTIEGAKYGQPSVAYGICSWAGSDGHALSIQLTQNASAADWLSTLATIQSDQSAGAPKPIAGLGDKAAGVGLEIAVQHGTTIIDIRDADTPGFGKWPKSTAIANAIIAGLH